ncbi:ErfK/YbiS/YcfS/YnhG family protein [Ktedonobacter racemifer DSM 44963]|uniref:ErfK/YbiS/YcfS/YnhG family protein n=1 Tax=Ktedonobacter racemifer DSM 44963 TaxID=485913 RepID=D6TUJ2_KTERA|nr:ErfK/YbiS/YcfS/YnhG family protein [Ktedonobacter racemifer DSM 44963]
MHRRKLTRPEVSSNVLHKKRLSCSALALLIIALLLQACAASSQGTASRSQNNLHKQYASRHDAVEPQVLSPITPAMLQTAQTKLTILKSKIDQLKAPGKQKDIYLQHYRAEQDALYRVSSSQDYIQVLIQIDTNITEVESEAAQGNSYTLVATLQQEAQDWGDAHKWRDAYDQKDYQLDSGYLSLERGYGAVPYLYRRLASVGSAAYPEVKDTLLHLAMLEADFADPTPYNQVHATDKYLLTYYHLQNNLVFVVSMTEQAMRVYQNGQLIRSFLVTTGRYDRPSPPGLWSAGNHLTHVPFISYDAPGSPDYYDPIMVNYAVQFRADGYFFHDSWWRKDYGPGTQFPHQDSGKNKDASVGSHGCVNLPTKEMTWVYQQARAGTKFIIY